jgi:hypothetical protein
MQQVEVEDMRRARAAALANYPQYPTAYVVASSKHYRDVALGVFADWWSVELFLPGYGHTVVRIGAADVPCKQCGVMMRSSAMTDDLCARCCPPVFSFDPMNYLYCDRTEELHCCSICGCACCPWHAWEMRDVVKTRLGISGHAIECQECVGK